MSDHDGESKALEHVTRELRNVEAPEPDWERMEQRLLARIDADETRTRRAGGYRIAAVLAAAAAILLLVGGVFRGQRQDVAENPPAAAAPATRVFGPSAGQLSGAELSVGDEVIAGAHALIVDHPGRARWTLDPSSHATVAGVGDVITLRLTSGALNARVVKSDKPETFVIEVDEARVAVHGTEFRVVRAAEGISVDVTEGVVAVGGRGLAAGFFLRAGDTGQFSSDGRSGHVKQAAVAEAPATEPPSKPSVSAMRPALPVAPSATELGKALDQIASAAASCFASGAAQGEVRVQLRTDVAISLGADGKLQTVRFDPPLSPTATECVLRQTAKVRVPESSKGGAAQRALLLGT
ncbi:MAG: FecR domain-containing protein [Myxococcales bacterium]|nr:FecR domain-containing protein [Myxococcales bacterium]